MNKYLVNVVFSATDLAGSFTLKIEADTELKAKVKAMNQTDSLLPNVILKECYVTEINEVK